MTRLPGTGETATARSWWSGVAVVLGGCLLLSSAMGCSDEGCIDARLRAADPPCSSDGWCWQWPFSYCATPSAVFGTASNDIWIGGGSDLFAHSDGSAWSRVRREGNRPATSVSAIWGSGPRDVWTVGASDMVHWNGEGWSWGTAAPGSSLRAVWGTGPDDTWAVGSKGGGDAYIIHWDGQKWTEMPVGITGFALHGVWGSSAGDAWAVGAGVVNGDDAPLVLRWDGAQWIRQSAGPIASYQPLAIWGSAADDVWIVGSTRSRGHALLHWDGTTWTDVSSTLPPAPARSSGGLRSISGAGRSSVWVAGGDVSEVGLPSSARIAHFDGSAWKWQITEGSALAVWHDPAGDSWAVGSSVVLHKKK